MRSPFMRENRRPAHCAFTLVELLVSIGIIALLVAMLMPVLSRVREQSRRVSCLSNLRSLGQAMYLYAGDYRDRLPNGNGPNDGDPDNGDQVLVSLWEQYLSAAAATTFHCPSDADPAPRRITNNYISMSDSARISYDFYSLYWQPERGPMLSRLRGQAPLAWDLGVSAELSALQNHGTAGGNVVWADGHANWLPASEWDAANWPAPARAFYPSTTAAAATAKVP
jgi:prepilin-type N-terminal cleavage/methylation domain-containing protein/prepilin-type processing-associated H-X9-DG protein